MVEGEDIASGQNRGGYTHDEEFRCGTSDDTDGVFHESPCDAFLARALPRVKPLRNSICDIKRVGEIESIVNSSMKREGQVQWPCP